jgi:multiple sugar transport system substrate-binding protein
LSHDPDKLASGLLSHAGPDVFESQLNLQMVRSKQIVPLDDITDPVRSDFTDIDLGSNTVDGNYGARMIDDPQILYYRKSMLAKAVFSHHPHWTNWPRPRGNSPPAR